MIGKTEALILYMVSEGVDDTEELKEIIPISGEELESILKKLENEGYLESSNGLRLTKKGFEAFMQEEVVKMIDEMKKHIERLASEEAAGDVDFRGQTE